MLSEPCQACLLVSGKLKHLRIANTLQGAPQRSGVLFVSRTLLGLDLVCEAHEGSHVKRNRVKLACKR